MNEKKLTTDEFFNVWCPQRGLTRNSSIAQVFGKSDQTIGAWRKRKPHDLPAWLELACEGYDVLREMMPGANVSVPPPTFTWFQQWCHDNGLNTFRQIGPALKTTSQGAHNWYRRGKLPDYIFLVCLGYQARVKRAARAAGLGAALCESSEIL